MKNSAYVYYSALWDFGFLLAYFRPTDRAADCRNMIKDTPKEQRRAVAAAISSGVKCGKKSRGVKL